MAYIKTKITKNEITIYNYKKGFQLPLKLWLQKGKELYNVSSYSYDALTYYNNAFSKQVLDRKWSYFNIRKYLKENDISFIDSKERNDLLITKYKEYKDKKISYHQVYKESKKYGFLVEDIQDIIDTRKRIKKNNFLNRQRKFLDLVDSNFKKNNSKLSFWTLTFKKGITDISKANKKFTKFINTDIKRYLKKNNIDYKLFKYMGVWELHKSGSIHYHLIVNLPELFTAVMKQRFSKVKFGFSKEISTLWSNGFIKILPVYKNVSVAGYLSKYLIKDFDKESKDFKFKKRYMYSRNISKPIIQKHLIDFLSFKNKYLKGFKVKKFWPKKFEIDGRVMEYDIYIFELGPVLKKFPFIDIFGFC